MATFTWREIVDATQGRFLAGVPAPRVSGISTDTRMIRKGQLFVAIKGDRFDGHDFLAQAAAKGARVFVVHRQDVEVPAGTAAILVDDTVKALGRIAREHRSRFDIPVIGVTGSAGKTSTKEFIAAVLGRKYRVLFNKGTENNHIGVPMTLLRLTRRHQAAVIEMGTNHPGEIAWLAQNTLPTTAVVTNVGASHLEGLGSLQGVFEEKLALVRSLPAGGLVVVNADDPYWARLLKKRLRQRTVSYGSYHRADIMAQDIMLDTTGVSFKVNGKYAFKIKSPSLGAVHNALAAIACGRSFGVSWGDVRAALAVSAPAKGRQCLMKAGGITLIDDTYNANPVSYKNAIMTLAMFKAKGRRVLVAADMLELGDHTDELHRDVGVAAARAGLDALFTCGQRTAVMAAGAKQSRASLDVRSFEDKEPLVVALKGYLRSGDVVLFKGSRGMRMENIFAEIKTFLKG